MALLFDRFLMINGLIFTLVLETSLEMVRSEPNDTEAIGSVGIEPPLYAAPVEGFTWVLEKRFGHDADGDPIAVHGSPNYIEYLVQVKDFFVMSIGGSYGSAPGSDSLKLIGIFI